MRKIVRLLVISLLFIVSGCAIAEQTDPLPSWNSTASKQAIIDLVERTTTTARPEFVPPSERIAVFDNDGTLWPEQPVYFQLLFAIDRIRTLAPQHPEWTTTEPYASLLKGDVNSVLPEAARSMIEIVMTTHAGITTDEFEALVTDWISRARHPTTKKLLTDMVYQPMLEVLQFLRANGFKTFIVSGGGVDFMRPWVEKAYGIPPEQVIGSSMKMAYEVRNGKPVLAKQAAINFINDKEGKPIGIQTHIGRRPIAAFGNSDGDLQMLEWTTGGPHPGFALIIHHTDSEREWAYDRESKVGRLDKALQKADKNGWTVVDMKRDWKVIYPAEKR